MASFSAAMRRNARPPEEEMMEEALRNPASRFRLREHQRASVIAMRVREAQPSSIVGLGVLAGHYMSGKDVAMVEHLARSPSPAENCRSGTSGRYPRVPVTIVVAPDIIVHQWVEKAVAAGVNVCDILVFVYASDVHRRNAWNNIHGNRRTPQDRRVVIMTADAFKAFARVSRQCVEAALEMDRAFLRGARMDEEYLRSARDTIERLGWPVTLDRIVFDHPDALRLPRLARDSLPPHAFSWIVVGLFSDVEDVSDVTRRSYVVGRMVTIGVTADSVVRCEGYSSDRDHFRNVTLTYEHVQRPGTHSLLARRDAAWDVRGVLRALDEGDGARAVGMVGVRVVDEEDGLETAVREARGGGDSSSVGVEEAVARAKNDDVCPIGMEDEPVRMKTVTVGCCQNVFDFANLVVGLAKDMTCPVCARRLAASDVMVVLPSSSSISSSSAPPPSLVTPLVRSCGLLTDAVARGVRRGDTGLREVATAVVDRCLRILAESPDHRVLIVFDHVVTPAMPHEREIVSATGGERLYSARTKTLWNRLATFRSGNPAIRVLVAKSSAVGEVGLDLGNVTHILFVVAGLHQDRLSCESKYNKLLASARAGNLSRPILLETLLYN